MNHISPTSIVSQSFPSRFFPTDWPSSTTKGRGLWEFPCKGLTELTGITKVPRRNCQLTTGLFVTTLAKLAKLARLYRDLKTSRLEMFPFCQLEYWLAMGIPPRLMGFLKQLDSYISHLHQETKQNKRIAKACPTIPCEIWLLRRMSTCHSIAEKISKTCTYHCLTKRICFRPCMKGTTRVLP